MESREPPRAARHRFMWMGSEAEPNSRWQNGHGRMRGRPFMGAPAAVDPGQSCWCSASAACLATAQRAELLGLQKSSYRAPSAVRINSHPSSNNGKWPSAWPKRAAWRASEGARGSPRLRLVGGACRPRRCDHKREVAFGKFSRRWVSPSLVGYGGRELERFLKELKIVGMRVQGAKVNSLREERGDLGQGGWGGKQRTWGGG